MTAVAKALDLILEPRGSMEQSAMALNLSAPLASVARAAMAYRNAEAALDDSHRNTPDADRALLWSDRYVALAALFAALDALEAAAEGGAA